MCALWKKEIITEVHKDFERLTKNPKPFIFVNNVMLNCNMRQWNIINLKANIIKGVEVVQSMFIYLFRDDKSLNFVFLMITTKNKST